MRQSILISARGLFSNISLVTIIYCRMPSASKDIKSKWKPRYYNITTCVVRKWNSYSMVFTNQDVPFMSANSRILYPVLVFDYWSKLMLIIDIIQCQKGKSRHQLDTYFWINVHYLYLIANASHDTDDKLLARLCFYEKQTEQSLWLLMESMRQL